MTTQLHFIIIIIMIFHHVSPDCLATAYLSIFKQIFREKKLIGLLERKFLTHCDGIGRRTGKYIWKWPVVILELM